MDISTLQPRDVVEAISSIRPDASFDISGNSVNWRGDDPPSRAEIEAAVAQHLASKRLVDTEAEITAHADIVTDQVLGGYPMAERLSFDRKAVAAELYLSGTASLLQRQIVESEAAITGESPATLASNIMAKVVRYSRIAAIIAGHRRSAIAAVRALGASAEVAALTEAVAAYKLALTEAVAVALAE